MSSPPKNRALPPSLRGRVVAALRRMFRPVVHKLIAQGITYPTIERLMKELYVEVAQSEFALPFKRLTDSRISLLTGVNRKEVSRLRREATGDSELIPVEGTPVTRVLGRWMAGPPYATPAGAPQPLPYEATDCDTPSFAQLVRDLGPDVPVRSVLDELLRLGLVEFSPDTRVTLLGQVNIPAGDEEGKLTLLASDPAELFSTIFHNIEEPSEPWLQRKVAYDNIGSEALSALREEARQLGEEFIRRANALLARYDRDRNPQAPSGDRSRFVLGTYAYEETTVPPPDEPGLPKRALPGRILKRSQ